MFKLLKADREYIICNLVTSKNRGCDDRIPTHETLAIAIQFNVSVRSVQRVVRQYRCEMAKQLLVNNNAPVVTPNSEVFTPPKSRLTFRIKALANELNSTSATVVRKEFIVRYNRNISRQHVHNLIRGSGRLPSSQKQQPSESAPQHPSKNTCMIC